MIDPLIITIPTIAITGSSGKTTTREILACILEEKWKVLRNIGNKNLPNNTKQIAEAYDSTIDAIVLELGMGKQGAGQKHCSHLQPNISIITNIGTAHYGNLGNSIESTAKNKSALIKYMKQDGLLVLNGDDENSKLLDCSTFKGRILRIGTKGNADYCASDICYVNKGMEFNVKIDGVSETFFLPSFGFHNIQNALLAIAVAHQVGFSATEIRTGLTKYVVPIKRLNVYELCNESLLIDDTVNANPQSVKAALDVQGELGEGKKRIVVLGSMLELGTHTEVGHKEVGAYAAQKGVDAILTYGRAAQDIMEGAIERGFDPDKVMHFKNREDMHREIKRWIVSHSIILVKGSSAMNMNKTVKFIKDRYFYSMKIDSMIDEDTMEMSSETYKYLDIEKDQIVLHFGQFKKKLKVVLNDKLTLGEMIIPEKLSNHLTIPPLPYEYYWEGDSLHVGPVIGMIVYKRYIDDPKQQIGRFKNYHQIKGLIYFFFPDTICKKNQTISGYYFEPNTSSFKWGTFPFPNSIFNRIPLRSTRFHYFQKIIGDTIFNYPYGNSDKLEFWKLMYMQPVIKKHLPRTKKYNDVNSVLKSLQKCDAVYLKPASLAGGAGIFHVKKTNEGYLWTDIEGNKSNISSKEQFIKILKSQLVKKKTYIIQEEIATFNKNRNKIDFRLYIQKDYTMQWRFSGIETKVGHKDSIIANSKKRQDIIPGDQALQEFYQMTQEQALKKIKDMTDVCIRILKIMEKKGHKLGDACFDLVVDREGEFWVLEPQLNYAAEIKQFREQGERRVLPEILPTPLEYAKALAKF
ncbi:YheC/YheD family protein [Metabacillus sp. HB246100]